MPRSSAPPPSRYLALVFPRLGVERLRSQRGHLFIGRAARPLATTERQGRTSCLASIDHAAAALGLVHGMPVVDARSRAPDLETFDADAGADLDWLAALAEGCTRYTPTVAIAPPDALVLDITATRRAERDLAAEIEARLARRELVVRHAFAHTPDAAGALARFTGGAAPDEHQALRRLPVAALDLGEDATAAMVDGGCRTIADLAALSPAGLAARFGAEAGARLRRLFDPLASPQPAARGVPVTVEIRPDPQVRLADAFRRLAEHAAAALDRRAECGIRFEARLFAVDGSVGRIAITPATPTSDPAAIERLLRARAPDTGDCDLMRLDVIAVEPRTAALFPPASGPAAASGPIRRRRTARAPAVEQPELGLTAAPVLQIDHPGPTRPIHLFDPPQPIRALPATTEGPPAAFRWRGTLHRVARASGPERCGSLPRDYYRVADGRGRGLWIFRHVGDDACGWYVHGVFA